MCYAPINLLNISLFLQHATVNITPEVADTPEVAQLSDSSEQPAPPSIPASNNSLNNNQAQVFRQLTSPLDRLGTNIDDLPSVQPPRILQLPPIQLPLRQNVFSVGPYQYNLNEDPLGLGSYGKVVRGWDSRNPERRCAIKIWKNQDITDTLQREYNMISSLDHEKIVKVYDYLHDEIHRPCMVMEYISGGELFTRIVSRIRYNESNARDVIKTLLEVIQYLHNRNIVHRYVLFP
jgi:hypothetical protein